MDTNSDSANGFKAVWDKGTLSFRQSSGDVKLLLGRGTVTGTPREIQRVNAPQALSAHRMQPLRTIPQTDSGEFKIEYMRVNDVSQSCVKRGDTVRLGLTGLGGLTLSASDFTVTLSGGSLSNPVLVSVTTYDETGSFIEFQAPAEIPYNGFESPQSSGDGTVSVEVAGFSDSTSFSEYVFAENTGLLTFGFLPDVMNTGPAYDYTGLLSSWPTEVQVRGYRNYMFRFVRNVSSKDYTIEAWTVAPGTGQLAQILITDVVGYLSHSGVFTGEPAYPFVQLGGLGARGVEKIMLQYRFVDGFDPPQAPSTSVPRVQYITSRAPTGFVNLSSDYRPAPDPGITETYPLFRSSQLDSGTSGSLQFPSDGFFYYGYNPNDPMKAFGCNEIVDLPVTGVPGYAGLMRRLSVNIRIPEHGFILVYLDGALITFSAFVNAGRAGSTDFNGSPANIILAGMRSSEFTYAADYAYSKFSTNGAAAKRFWYTPFVFQETAFISTAIPDDGLPHSLKVYFGWAQKMRPAYNGDLGAVPDEGFFALSFQALGSIVVYGEDPVEDWDAYSLFSVNFIGTTAKNMVPVLIGDFTL
jgi:hypothetical protein